MSGGNEEISLADLFRVEANGQIAALTDGLLRLDAGDSSVLESLMRAAHSLKGAARIVGVNAAVTIAHAMEDCFVAAQRGEQVLRHAQVDRLLTGVDLLGQIARTGDAGLPDWDAARAADVEAFVTALRATLAAGATEAAVEPRPSGAASPDVATATFPTAPPPATPLSAAPPVAAVDDRTLRVSADRLNRLLGLSAESLVESRRLRPFTVSLTRLKRLHQELASALENVRERLARADLTAAQAAVGAAEERLAAGRGLLADRLAELEGFDRRASVLADRLYNEALAVRMRPFRDAVGGLPRMARDVARQLGKQVRLEVLGEETAVDRDILEQLEAPLGHLVRNAIDHGIELPEERLRAGKPPAGRVRIEARHSAGVLLVAVSDDGRGLEPAALRAAVLRRGLVNPATAAQLSDAELMEFLFLPGFTLRDTVTDISGRGVGLDAVQTTLKAVRGTARASSQPGLGMRFELQLPLTLSVVRALLVDVAGEPYALPLGFIGRALDVPAAEISSTSGRAHIAFGTQRIGLVSARQVLGLPASATGATVAVVVLGETERRHGLVVDRFLGERELVVQPLDPRLGKVPNVAAGALLDDGSPVLILDVADVLRSVERIAATGAVQPAAMPEPARAAGGALKRVLVVDDSLTVRELERKLLRAAGYAVEIAVDGMEGWNTLRTGAFDLVISDVDMPRLDGIEFTKLIKADPKLRTIPVMIVSYKDREEDRRRGLDAGADYYLTKASFHDETMINAVADLIGPAREPGGAP